MTLRTPIRRRLAPLAVPLALAAVWPGPASAAPSASGLYLDPHTQVSTWLAQNPGDERAPRIKAHIADVPRATWFASYEPQGVKADVRAVTGAAEQAGRIPALVAYMIPNRDCNSHSAGGAPDLPRYQEWITQFAQGLGSGEVIVLLEPDAIVQATRGDQCRGVDVPARLAALKQAGATIKRTAPNARVYYDAGHSGWQVDPRYLLEAGVAQGDGIVTNVSNFRTTADETAYGKALLDRLGTPSLGLVVDTSRNGNGPHPSAEWCNPEGRALGTRPTLTTGDPQVHGYLWVKQPGESDGSCRGYKPAGRFDPVLADQLVRNAAGGSGPSDPQPEQPGTRACAAAYRPGSSWGTGHTAELAVTNGGAALDGWTLTWTFPAGQRMTQHWNMAAVQDGATVTARPVAHNTRLDRDRTVTVGYAADGALGKPSRVTLDGTSCTVS
ncbi:glycoside hydrolase family 6 protein [Streptomyces kanasensis]|uniref:glycoside hydrolase family 6 protein n=1 Tax=Streptomyces kanasensis TaxID=936756 RepID=UPI0036F5DAD8